MNYQIAKEIHSSSFSFYSENRIQRKVWKDIPTFLIPLDMYFWQLSAPLLAPIDYRWQLCQLNQISSPDTSLIATLRPLTGQHTGCQHTGMLKHDSHIACSQFRFFVLIRFILLRNWTASVARAAATVGKRRVVPASADWTPAINHRLVARSFFSSSALRSGTLALVFGAPVVNPGGREELWVPSRGCVGPSLSPSSSWRRSPFCSHDRGRPTTGEEPRPSSPFLQTHSWILILLCNAKDC